jgi:hypothetical protein
MLKVAANTKLLSKQLPAVLKARLRREPGKNHAFCLAILTFKTKF